MLMHAREIRDVYAGTVEPPRHGVEVRVSNGELLSHDPGAAQLLGFDHSELLGVGHDGFSGHLSLAARLVSPAIGPHEVGEGDV